MLYSTHSVQCQYQQGFFFMSIFQFAERTLNILFIALRKFITIFSQLFFCLEYHGVCHIDFVGFFFCFLSASALASASVFIRLISSSLNPLLASIRIFVLYRCLCLLLLHAEFRLHQYQILLQSVEYRVVQEEYHLSESVL